MTRPSPRPKTAATKAVLATATAVVGSLATAASDSHITLAEWLIAAGAGLAAAGVVYRIPNGEKG